MRNLRHSLKQCCDTQLNAMQPMFYRIRLLSDQFEAKARFVEYALCEVLELLHTLDLEIRDKTSCLEMDATYQRTRSILGASESTISQSQSSPNMSRSDLYSGIFEARGLLISPPLGTSVNRSKLLTCIRAKVVLPSMA